MCDYSGIRETDEAECPGTITQQNDVVPFALCTLQMNKKMNVDTSPALL